MSTRTAPKPRAVIGTPWWLRLAIYVVVAIVGLVLTAMGLADTAQVDSWLGQVGSLAAVIGGLVAAVNTGRESDEKPVAVEVPVSSATPGDSLPPAEESLPVYDGRTTAFTANPFVEPGGRHRAEEA